VSGEDTDAMSEGIRIPGLVCSEDVEAGHIGEGEGGGLILNSLSSIPKPEAASGLKTSAFSLDFMTGILLRK
jgi:hypothetical protein